MLSPLLLPLCQSSHMQGSGGFLPAGMCLDDGSTWLGTKEGMPLLWSKGECQ